MSILTRIAAIALASLGLLSLSRVSAAATACLLTPAELQAATGRAYAEGKSGKDITGMYDQCIYAEKDKPQRQTVLSLRTEKARQQFESSKRLLQRGNEPIDIAGVGDAAYFSGTGAGVLKGERAILLNGLRRASDPKIEREKIAALLRQALDRLGER